MGASLLFSPVFIEKLSKFFAGNIFFGILMGATGQFSKSMGAIAPIEPP